MKLYEAVDLVWKEVLEEDKENFTPEFRKKVIDVVLRIGKELKI